MEVYHINNNKKKMSRREQYQKWWPVIVQPEVVQTKIKQKELINCSNLLFIWWCQIINIPLDCLDMQRVSNFFLIFHFSPYLCLHIQNHCSKIAIFRYVMTVFCWRLLLPLKKWNRQLLFDDIIVYVR